MRFVISSTVLLSHLQTISRVINSKNALPILDCFLLELKGDTLKITAADNETRLETSVKVNEHEGKGKFAIDAKNLLDPLKELSDQPLTFEINDENLETFIYYHNGKYNFVALNGNEYPQSKPLKENAQSLVVSPDILLSGINRTLFASADDELRPVMNGIFFDISTEDVIFVASDGHKLVRDKNSEARGSEKSSFILPRKPANLLKALLPKESNEIKFLFDENNAQVILSNFTMTCRFIEGRYPNYNSVIPQNNSNRAIIDRLSFLNALKRVSIFSNAGSNLIKIDLKENDMMISAQDIDFSTSAEEKVVCQYNGVPINIGFKSAFLIEMLSNIPSSDVFLDLSDASRAALLIPAEQEENDDLLMLLMPMMLND